MMETNDIVSYIRKFHEAGWMPGSVGAIAQLIVHNESSKKILVTPDNLDINVFTSSDLFTLRDLYGTQEIQTPLKGNFSISKWATTFFSLLVKTEAKCVAFVSTHNSCLISRKAIQLWNEKSESHPNLLRLSYWGLIRDLGNQAEISIPIVDCTAAEAPAQVSSVFDLYVNSFPAILVRNYGLLVWEDSLSLLRNKIEILDRLFALQLNSDF